MKCPLCGNESTTGHACTGAPRFSTTVEDVADPRGILARRFPVRNHIEAVNDMRRELSALRTLLNEAIDVLAGRCRWGIHQPCSPGSTPCAACAAVARFRARLREVTRG